MDSLTTHPATAFVSPDGSPPKISPYAKRSWIMSVDLGQSFDNTGIAVLEVVTREQAWLGYMLAPESEREQFTHPPKAWWRQQTERMAIAYPKLPARIFVRHLNRLPLKVPYPDQID